MATWPTVKVELSTVDPAGTPSKTDISAYIIDDGVKIDRGRNSELDRFQAGTAAVQLNNNDGRFDPTYASGPHYPNLRPLNRLWISANWNAVDYPAITGYADGWVPEYPGPDSSIVNLAIHDAFAVLAIPTVQVTAPTADRPNLVQNPSFEDDLPDWAAFGTGTSFVQDPDRAEGQACLLLTFSGGGATYGVTQTVSGLIPGKTYRLSGWIKRTAAVGRVMIDVFETAVIDTSGISIASAAGTLGSAWQRFGELFTYPAGGSGTVAVRCWADTTPVGTARFDDIHLERTDDNIAILPEERADLRIGRILDAIGWPAADRALSTLPASILLEQLELGTTSVLDYLQQIEQSANGRLWINQSGLVKYLSRWDMGLAPYLTSQATFGQTGSDLLYVDIVPSYDLTFVRNEIRLTSLEPNAVAQVAEDTTSQGHYYRRPMEASGLLVNSNELADAADYLLARYATIHERFVSLDLGGLLDPTNQWPQILGRELGDRITVKFNPPGAPPEVSQECFIEGIHHQWSRNAAWATTFNLSAFGVGMLLYPVGKNFFILGDATHGVLTTGDGVLVY